MGFQRQAILGRLAVFLALALVLVLPGLAAAQGSVTVELASRNGSTVTGNAVLIADGEGTNITLDLTGLPANTEARATMNAGTCDQPSASSAALPELKADASGKATAIGKIYFRGADDVSLATMADGQHVISIVTDKVVACGVIPALASAGATTASSPSQTGGGRTWLVVLLALVGLGLVVTVLAFVLRSRSRPSLR